jgi:cytochrome c
MRKQQTRKMMGSKGIVMRISLPGIARVVLLVLVAGPAVAADADHGKALFETCAACHSDRPDALGPNLKGVFGRPSASLDGYRYSNPMKRAGLVWDEANLRDYISNPQSKVKGNRMPYGGMSDPKDVDDIIAYLQTLK